jgi:uncharacterized protein YjbK
MKTVLLTLALLIATLVFSENPNHSLARQSLVSTQMEIVEDEAIEIRLNNPLAKELRVEVRTEYGLLIMKRKLSNVQEYAGRYEFSNLAQGNYTFDILLNEVLIDQVTVQIP